MRVAAEELYQAALDQQVDLLDDDPVSLSAVVQRIVSGRSPKCDERRPIDGEWGVLKVSSVRRLQFDGREAKKLPDGEALFPNAEVQPGDLLTIRASGSRRLVGAFCIAEDPPARRLMSDYHWRVELDPARADRRYVAHIMGATAVRDELELAIVGSTTAAKLSKGRLLEVAIPLPASLVDQKRIARQLDALHSVVRTSQEQLVTLRAVHRSALRQLLAEDATPLVAA
jgi:type I restriction enzyme S subunit